MYGFGWYFRAVEKRPFALNVVSGFVLAFGGDIVCQTQFESGKSLFHKDEEVAKTWRWNEARSWELGVLRAALLGPWTHVYYPWLMRTIPGAGLKYAMGRALLDQFVGSPVVICLVWFGSDIYNGRYNSVEKWADSFASTVAKVEDQGPNAWKGGAQFWPIVHTINFWKIPPLHQPMFAHVFSIYWNAILSYYNNCANINKAELAESEGGEAAIKARAEAAALEVAKTGPITRAIEAMKAAEENVK